MKKEYKGKIVNIEKASLDVIKLQIESDLKSVRPGQFISILCPNRTLRRPFSTADFENGILTLLIKLKGEGTNYLSKLKKGDEVNFLAPLGNVFDIPENKKVLLVGAGIGIAPMLFLKKELNKKNISNHLITGFKTEKEIIEGSDEVTIGGSVLDNLSDIVNKKNIDIICSCGPSVVLEGVCKIAKKHDIKAFVAMEKVMACGIGVCRGCVIKVQKDGIEKYASVCKDGPVFSSDEIIWE